MKKIIGNVTLCFLAFAILLLGLLQENINIAEASNDLELSSKSAILMEYDSGEILFSKEDMKHLPVASMVKMMTILIALEELEEGNVTLDTKITTTENASSMGGSQVFLDPYVEYSFEDLLKSVIMASANDASVALAEYFNGNEKAFTNRMNRKAKELEMNDTNYVNCTGLPAPEQYSSAKDSAKLLREILKHDVYHNYSGIWIDKLTHPSGRETELVNTNRLIRYYEGCDGGKTGSTNEAGCCLCASAKRGDMRLISVVIGAENSKTRFNESATLLNYGFSNFESQKLIDENVSLTNVKVLKGKSESVEVFAQESFSAVTKKGGKSDYETQINIENSVVAPTHAGEKVGEAVVLKNGNIVKTIPLILKENIKHLSWFETTQKIVQKW